MALYASSGMHDVLLGSYQRKEKKPKKPKQPAAPISRSSSLASPVSPQPQELEGFNFGVSTGTDKGKGRMRDASIADFEETVPVQVPFEELHVDGIAWQDFDLPQELEKLDPRTPAEICNVVTESLVRLRASAGRDASASSAPIMSGGVGYDGRPISVISVVSGAGSDRGPTSPGPHVVVSRPYGSPTAASPQQPPAHVRSQSGASSTTTAWASQVSQVGSHRQSVASSRSSVSSGVAESTMSKTSTTKSRQSYAAGPAGFLPLGAQTEGYAGPRYVPPKLESPYAKKFKKMFRDRKGAGECASCLDDMKNKKLIPLACQHKYCAPCFTQLVTTAMQDEHYFPPKCCLQDIPAKLVQSHLSSEQKSLYKAKADEYAVPAGDRWYCPYTACAKWIDRKLAPAVDAHIRCCHCKNNICVICRGEAHAAGTDCPQDFGMEAALEESDRNGWRRCYQCHAMVELATGCRHMTCRCKAEFCYVCGARWKTCACTEQDKMARLRQVEERRAVLSAEELEVAEAIAAVERAQEEEARQEAEREARRQAEEALAAERREVARMADIQEAFAMLRAGLASLHDMQKKAMEARHADEKLALAEQKKNVLQDCEARHAREVEALEVRLEEEEDDYFLGIRAHLRGKPNREAREKAALEKIKKVQEEERESLSAQQQAERDELARGEEAMRAESKTLSGAMTQHDRRQAAEKHWLNLAVRTRARIVTEDERAIGSSGEDLRTYERRVGRVLASEGPKELTAEGEPGELAAESKPRELDAERKPGELAALMGKRVEEPEAWRLGERAKVVGSSTESTTADCGRPDASNPAPAVEASRVSTVATVRPRPVRPSLTENFFARTTPHPPSSAASASPRPHGSSNATNPPSTTPVTYSLPLSQSRAGRAAREAFPPSGLEGPPTSARVAVEAAVVAAGWGEESQGREGLSSGRDIRA